MINLIQGDCFEEMPKIKSQSVDMVITSPPYNRKRNDKYNNHIDIENDYVAFLKKTIEECLRICKGNVFFNIQKNTYNMKDVHKIIGNRPEIRARSGALPQTGAVWNRRRHESWRGAPLTEGAVPRYH